MKIMLVAGFSMRGLKFRRDKGLRKYTIEKK